MRSRLVVAAFLLWLVAAPVFSQEIYYNELPADVIEARLRRVNSKNDARQQTLKQLFEEVECSGDRLMEQAVKRSRLPNVICELPGTSLSVIVVGAHFDKVIQGSGVVDNWSGAALLPTLYQSLHSKPRRSTYRFIGFTDEEKGMYGSSYYVDHVPLQERGRIVAMVNIDSLGLSSTKVWVRRADKQLIADLLQVAEALHLKVEGVSVDQVGDSDSHPFAAKKIPVIDFHSLTQANFSIIHSMRDIFSAVHLADYYDSYRLLAAYLAFLDEKVDTAPRPVTK